MSITVIPLGKWAAFYLEVTVLIQVFGLEDETKKASGEGGTLQGDDRVEE